MDACVKVLLMTILNTILESNGPPHRISAQCTRFARMHATIRKQSVACEGAARFNSTHLHLDSRPTEH